MKSNKLDELYQTLLELQTQSIKVYDELKLVSQSTSPFLSDVRLLRQKTEKALLELQHLKELVSEEESIPLKRQLDRIAKEYRKSLDDDSDSDSSQPGWSSKGTKIKARMGSE